MIKKIVRIFLVLIISIITIYSVFIIAQKIIFKEKTPSIFGIKSYIVLSGSMEPTINVGDIVFVRETDDIEEQDIISFKVNNSVVTHRIVEIIENEKNEKQYKTKGDANPLEDIEIVKNEDIEGKYYFKIDKIGNIVIFLKTKIGISILIFILALSIFLTSNKLYKTGKHSL